VDASIDVAASVALIAGLSLVLGAHVISSLMAGRPLVAARVEREPALPFVGKAPMHAVYRALVPLGRALAALGVSANGVSVTALGIAGMAAIAFGTGHFGLGAVIASVAALADGLDGLVARLSGSKSRFGQVLDTTIDRYVDALFLGGIAIYVRFNAALLAVTIIAIVGSFMVSYASSVERELGVEAGPAPMRRPHRLAYLITASACAPLLAAALPLDVPAGELLVVFVAVGAIAVVGNVSAVRRLFAAARVVSARESAPASGPDVEHATHLTAGGARR
jgi:CDP-diacylglycerol--glycerol-3-phosphate 3-phosphatidyltransferase